MKCTDEIPLVTTIKERCRVCFTCVRECPAKAIRIVDGQAEVIAGRCIGCGNCVRVCSQHAKVVRDCTGHARELLAGSAPVAACLAPSFPAEFDECDYRHLVGMVRALGFQYVHEVAFGADLVANRYKRLMDHVEDRHYIATSCPAVVAFVERCHPDLVPALAPIVSPMIATARALRQIHEGELRIVFIGPCIAKKGEMLSDELPNDVDACLAFTELRQLFETAGIRPEGVTPSDFNPPHGGVGALFPISRGLLQAADIDEDLMAGEVVTANGRENFTQAIKEFETEEVSVRLLEVLACNGCIDGPGIGNEAPLFKRRAMVARYVRERAEELDAKRWREDIERFHDLDLSREYRADDQRLKPPSEQKIAQILVRMGKSNPKDELNCGACGYRTCREHAIAIHGGLAESEMCLPYLIEELKSTLQDLGLSHEELAKAQQALVQSEKLAHMGQLAAGVAHELNNPLGVVLMYAHLLQRERSDDEKLHGDLDIITSQADRCKKIVAGLLHFARQNKVLLEATDMGDVIRRSIEAAILPERVVLKLEPLPENSVADMDRDQITQVLTNLITNACAAMPGGGALTIKVQARNGHIETKVSDTGSGIPEEHRAKIFEPFFTTKEIGKGTGLGLAVAYGIVKMHHGDISVDTNTDPERGPTGTTFTVSLPKHEET